MSPSFAKPAFDVSTPDHFKALAHPLRHRLMFALGEPATISQLAKRLATGKGNIAHHIKVLTEAGMVHVVSTRTVRGGTEQYYQRTAARLDFASEAAETTTAASLAAVAQELIGAADDPLLVLRHLRLSPAKAARLRALLEESLDELEPDSDHDPRYGVMVTMYRQHDTDDD
ncbi:winged helix-turn-helix domain-containing protein [Stackebrandtia nassauensis]|uniref:Transcriptional regulator, ArsR family n=1 Tax=Stackebrandtia nassauensis (strain DSM 44728 / CIP 108903 / NRRL B-16338 / NBRC 102104 / LLR-40K-21) TaxID=446470 RepID=D3Q8X2_STANL|nr:winged helix-turn-helix domain-containing protein [Stackebrandtia nassauensis]ADD40581.1 transcriptional regulator, ArsR family [Stackebrandtia nassauensis DSM 44728]